MDVNKHLELLGMKVKDKVTGVEGVVTSISFDLYGCIQGCITPAGKDDGSRVDAWWYDISRLATIADVPVMKPNFTNQDISKGDHGPADKPVI